MCRIASLFLLQRLKGSMLGDARDFNNIELSSLFSPLHCNAPKEIHAILTETLGEHLLPGLKTQLKSHNFSSDAEVIAAAETWLEGPTSEFFLLKGLLKLEQRAKKCIELRGEYVE